MVTVLVSKERQRGGFCASVVPQKGSGGGYIMKQVTRDLTKFGVRKTVILRSDNEPAMEELLEKVGKSREGETLIENAPKEDIRANGRAERAVQSIEK